jgi:hypothetical protein
MATIDDLVADLKVAVNRPTILDGAGNDVSTTWFPLQINFALRRLQRRLVGPWQTYTWPLVTVAGNQCYPLQEQTLPAGVGDYRSTKSITLPYQQAAQRYGYGQRLNYLPHALARQKYQLIPQAGAMPPPPGQGFPNDYSIFWSTAISIQVSERWNAETHSWASTPTDRWSDLYQGSMPGVAYWFWPVPDQGYTLTVDQLRFLPDLVAGSGADNWLTRELPDVVLAEAAVQATRVLGDDAKMQRFTGQRNEAYDAAQIMQALQFDEAPHSAGMIELG